jgi:cytoskeletal protein RodZ
MWGWLAIVGGALVAWRLYSSKNAAAQAAQSGTSTSSTDTSANTVPQFVNQTYVSTTAPASPGTAGGTPATPNPTNPAPVGTSTQPKPTTTSPASAGGWNYPAPSGLATYDTASSGVRLQWNAVTGPSGQHPNSYTVATYNSKGKLVDQFSTQAGNTNTAEYGKGGKGLPKGTYHTNVWANGGPVAPPHASVQYTLKG